MELPETGIIYKLRVESDGARLCDLADDLREAVDTVDAHLAASVASPASGASAGQPAELSVPSPAGNDRSLEDVNISLTESNDCVQDNPVAGPNRADRIVVGSRADAAQSGSEDASTVDSPGNRQSEAPSHAESEAALTTLESEPTVDSAKCEEAESVSDEPSRKSPKRSTVRGEGQAKLIAALTKHHKYADGGCLNLESIGSNQLSREAAVSPSTASEFFKKEFGGHTKYRNLYCRDSPMLAAALKKLNGEYTVDELFGARPPDEDDRGDEE